MSYLERQFTVMRNVALVEEEAVVRYLKVMGTVADSARGLHDVEDNDRVVESEAAGFLWLLNDMCSVYGNPPEVGNEALVGAASLALMKETCGDSRLGPSPSQGRDELTEKPKQLGDPGAAKKSYVTDVTCQALLILVKE